MENQNPKSLQLFVRLLNGKTAIVTFSKPEATGHEIKRRILDLTKIPASLQRLISNGYQIRDETLISSAESTINLVLSLRGGKGGFGSLLRGAATKAGQKKTNNFDACRDMSGRRLRHVNAEKRLEEWKAEEEERRMEKVAEEFLKKVGKKGKQGVGDGEVKRYVERYREESARCVEAVDAAVKEALANRKRKGKMVVSESGSAEAKRLKIWMGKRIMGDIDSDDSSDDEENEKSAVLNNSSQLSSNKDTDGSTGSVTGGRQDGELPGGASCESGSEEEKENIGQQSFAADRCSGAEDVPKEEIGSVQPELYEEKLEVSPKSISNASIANGNEADQTEEDIDGPKAGNLQEVFCQPSSKSSAGNGEAGKGDTSASIVKGVHEVTDAANAKGNGAEKPLNFDDFKSAADLEVLGMERLKSELQSRGLKCGGTLEERAARLFLLKSTPLEKIPKKLLAKK